MARTATCQNPVNRSIGPQHAVFAAKVDALMNCVTYLSVHTFTIIGMNRLFQRLDVKECIRWKSEISFADGSAFQDFGLQIKLPCSELCRVECDAQTFLALCQSIL